MTGGRSARYLRPDRIAAAHAVYGLTGRCFRVLAVRFRPGLRAGSGPNGSAGGTRPGRTLAVSSPRTSGDGGACRVLEDCLVMGVVPDIRTSALIAVG